jgi:hypothetical protein
MSFEGPTETLTIASLDDGTTCYADYNPKEVQLDRTVPWQPHNKANASGLQLEFSGSQGREMSLELFFDGFEDNISVQTDVDLLEVLATVRDPDSQDDQMRRPHHCVVTWGDNGIPKFQCVIESLSTKYTMFGKDGTPLRATVSIKLKEADRLTMAASSDGSSGGAPS